MNTTEKALTAHLVLFGSVTQHQEQKIKQDLKHALNIKIFITLHWKPKEKMNYAKLKFAKWLKK